MNPQLRKSFGLLSALLALVLLITACATPAPAPAAPAATPQVIEVEKEVVVTQIVEVEKEVVVTATPEPMPAAEAEPINLRFTVWTGSEAHLAMLNGIGDAYSALHPNVTVQFDTIPFSDYATKLAIQLSGNNPPDAGWMPESLAVPFLDAGAMADLGPRVKGDPDYDFGDLSEAAMSLYLRDDAVYGIPFSTSPHLVYFNKDLFAQAGVDTPDQLYARGEWTWETLANSAKAVYDATGEYGFQTIGLGIYKEHLTQSLAEFTRAWGGDIWDAEGKTCLLNTPESVAALQWYHDMVFKDGSAVPPGEEVDFNSGGSAMKPGYLSDSGRLGDAPFEWGLVRLPSGPAGWASVIGQSSIVAFAKGQHPETAVDFVAFMTNQENVTTMAQFFPPIRQSVLDSEEFLQANPLVKPEDMQEHVIPSIANGRLLPTHSNFEKIRLAISPIFDAMWTPDADVAASMEEACQAMAPYLNP